MSTICKLCIFRNYKFIQSDPDVPLQLHHQCKWPLPARTMLVNGAWLQQPTAPSRGNSWSSLHSLNTHLHSFVIFVGSAVVRGASVLNIWSATVTTHVADWLEKCCAVRLASIFVFFLCRDVSGIWLKAHWSEIAYPIFKDWTSVCPHASCVVWQYITCTLCVVADLFQLGCGAQFLYNYPHPCSLLSDL